MAEEVWQAAYRRLLGDDGFAKLKKFMAVVEAIRQRPYFKVSRRLLPKIKIRNTPEGFLTTLSDYDHGNLEQLRSAMIAVRPLLLKDDDTFINAIVGLLVRFDDEPERVDFLKEQRRQMRSHRQEMAFYSIPPDAPPTQLDDSGTPILEPGRTYEDLLQATLYRELFHWGDSDGKPTPPNLNVVDYLADTVPEAMKRGMLIGALCNEAAFACWLSDFVKTKGTWPNPARVTEESER